MELVHKVNQLIIEEQLLSMEDSIVVAVSGGPDSIALLHILFLLAEQWKWRLIVAHVNHQFRGEESDREADFVAEYTNKLGLSFELGVIDVPRYMRENKLNGQTAAREKRYEFLLNTAEKHSAKHIALAHHADDQAETILMRLLRGTGSLGLTGIPLRRTIKNMELIRPLLRIYKSEVIEYCQEHNLSFCIDSSNQHNKYLRNRIRNDLIPLLKQYNQQLPKVLNRLADVMRTEDDFIAQEVDHAFQKEVAVTAEGMQFSRTKFGLLHPALQRRLIKLILSYLAPNTDSFDFLTLGNVYKAILQEKPSTLTLDLGASITLTREYEQVLFRTQPTSSKGFHYDIHSWNDHLVLPDGSQLHCDVYERRESDLWQMPDSNNTAIFDLDSLCLPLYVRERRDGDRIEMRGLNGSKKVKDIFIDAKLPPRLRNQVPLVIDAKERILWIPGFRRSIHASVSSHSLKILCMELQRTL